HRQAWWSGHRMDGDNFGDGRHPERRRHRPASQSPMHILRQLPALVVLGRLPVPVLAVGDDGTLLFANAAFGPMLGHPPEAVLSLRFAQTSAGQPADTSPIMFIRTHAHQLVELVHRDGSTVRATMSPSALLRAEDTVALDTFHDRTEELWLHDR